LVDDTFLNVRLGGGIDGPDITCLALQTDGRILVGGSFGTINGAAHGNIGRLYPDGTLDTNFTASAMGPVYGVLPQPDGRILVGGPFKTVNGLSRSGMCRLNYDGSLDTNFNALVLLGIAGPSAAISSMSLQPDGKIVVFGSFTSIAGISRTNVARLNPDGSADSSFQPVAFAGVSVSGYLSPGPLLLQPDGKVVIGSQFKTVNGLAHTNLVRLNADGTLDNDFKAQADLYNCNGVQTLTLQTDGRIIVGDDSKTLNGQPCPYLGRLNGDGSLDAGFRTNIVSGPVVFSSALQSDGKMLLGVWGRLSSPGVIVQTNLGRLINTDMATQRLNYDGTNIVWLRGGTSPEIWRSSFEASTNGTDWTYLGDGVRMSGGWQLTNVSVSAGAVIRARGFSGGGCYNGSTWFVESVYPQKVPAIAVGVGGVGTTTNGFSFTLSGSAGSTVTVESSCDAVNWIQLATNMLTLGTFYCTDPSATNSHLKFYRAGLQP
jgi:uncharacterized delta-60 repeat protein